MIKLEYGKYYHVFNRGNNRENLFLTDSNYKHFLRLYEKYIPLIADTYAWCLMKNHFHFLVKIKEEKDIIPFSEPSKTLSKVENLDSGLEVINPTTDRTGNFNPTTDRATSRCQGLQYRKLTPSRQFSHLFNAYAQSFNKAFNRTGCLFETPFQRKVIDSEEYLRQIIIYIHLNPVRHGFTDDFRNYPWSSYEMILSSEPSKSERMKVINWFDDIDNFKVLHTQKSDMELIKNLIFEEYYDNRNAF